MPNKPNILFLFTDDQRFDTIAALGNPDLQTPNIDQLVQQGTAFTHAHIPGGTCGAICMPSRAMLMTGRTLFHLEGEGQNIPPEHVTMGQHLQKYGYQTYGTGKWHNGHESYARSFTDGAEIFFGGMDDHWNVPAHNFDPTGQYDNIAMSCWDPFYSNRTHTLRCDHIHPGKHSSELFADATVNMLQKQSHEKPFFMYVSFMAPHDPRTMPEKFCNMYNSADIELPPNFKPAHELDTGALEIRDELLAAFPRNPEEIKRHIAEYYAMITHLDYEIGRIIQSLKDNGQYENTIIAFAGDNGLAVGQHGLMGKQSLYEHSVRVPLIFCGPGIPKGHKRDQMVYLLDIFPTLCELLQIDQPGSVDGNSFADSICDADTAGRDKLYLVYKQTLRGVSDGRHKLIEYACGASQLFDLLQDPWEMNNLAEDSRYDDMVKAFRCDLLKFRQDWDEPQYEPSKDFRQARKDIL